MSSLLLPILQKYIATHIPSYASLSITEILDSNNGNPLHPNPTSSHLIVRSSYEKSINLLVLWWGYEF